MEKIKCKIEIQEKINTLFCEVFGYRLGLNHGKVTTLIYNNKIIVFTTDCLTEPNHVSKEKKIDSEYQRKLKINEFESLKQFIKVQIEKYIDCKIIKIEFFVGTNGIYLAHIILCQTQ